MSSPTHGRHQGYDNQVQQGIGRLPPYLRAGSNADDTDIHGAEAGIGPPAGPVSHQAPDPPVSSTALRPFVLTQGRVGDETLGISLETQVTTNPGHHPGENVAVSHLPSELQGIVALCVQSMSVAEISARLHLHLGVTKILVSDLRAAGHLEVHVSDPSNPHSAETILRVIRGLRAIS